MEEFDVAVLGGGVAGVSAAMRVAELGGRVCVIEQNRIGGRLVHKGTYPCRQMMSLPEGFWNSKSGQIQSIAGKGGLEPDDIKDLFILIKKTSLAISEKWEKTLKQMGVQVFKGRGILTGPGSVRVESPKGQQNIKAGKILLATGSSSIASEAIPFDGERIISEDDVFGISEIPEKTLVLGGGKSACEVATVFNRLGSKTFLCDEGSGLLPEIDPDLVSILAAEMKRRKIKLLLGKKVISIFKDLDKIDVTLEGGVKFSVQTIVFAHNRKAETQSFRESDKFSGFQVGQDGEILVDEKFQTSMKGIYAVGSVTGRVSWESLSREEGRVAAANCFGKEMTLNKDHLPKVIYGSPEIACLGVSAKEAHFKGWRGVEGKCDFRETDYFHLHPESKGLFKIAVDKPSRKIIGAQIASSQASEIIPLILLMVKKELKVNALASLGGDLSAQFQGIRLAAKDCLIALRESSGKART